MKKIISLLTLVFFVRFSERRMTMSEGTLFVPPRVLVRVGMTNKASKDEMFGWVDTVYFVKDYENALSLYVIDHPVHRIIRQPMEHKKFRHRGIPPGNQSDHSFACFM